MWWRGLLLVMSIAMTMAVSDSLNGMIPLRTKYGSMKRNF